MTSLGQIDDYYEMDDDSTWPATAPASGSGHAANPIHVANQTIASTIVPGSQWTDGCDLLATAPADTATSVEATQTDEGEAKSKGPSSDAGQSSRKWVFDLGPLVQSLHKWIIPPMTDLPLDVWD